MLIIILVEKLVTTGIIWGIGIDTLHLLSVPLLQ